MTAASSIYAGQTEASPQKYSVLLVVNNMGQEGQDFARGEAGGTTHALAILKQSQRNSQA